MQAPNIIPLVGAFFLSAVGVALLFVRVNTERLRAMSHTMPGLALYRFRAYRYFTAFVFFCLAALSVVNWAGLL